MEYQDKRYLYKTAYSPLFEEYVGIVGVFQDVNGEFLFTGYLASEKSKEILFRESELDQFCL